MHSTVSGAATTTREEFNALAAVHRVVWPEGFWRRDIGWRALG